MERSYPLSEIRKDFELAITFKRKGEEGQSRVTARKAAGKAVRFWLIKNKLTHTKSISPFQALKIALNISIIPNNICLSLRNLTQKVNTDYSFPENINLIDDANNIIEFISKKVSNDKY